MKKAKVEFGGRETGDRKTREQAAQDAIRRRNKRREGVTRLLKSQAFRDWFFEVMDDLCGFDNGLDLQDDFVQGKRASASFLKRSLLIGEGSAEFLGELTARYFKADREGIAAADNNNIGTDR